MLTAIADTKDLLQYAMHHNCLVIDANNKSDVHKYDVSIEELSSTFFVRGNVVPATSHFAASKNVL